MPDSCMIQHVTDLDAMFSDESMVVAPGKTRDQPPKTGANDQTFAQKVSEFESKYSVWIFQLAEIFVYGENAYARIMPKSDQDKRRVEDDAGFAILGLLNPYFELIGKLTGDFPNYPYKDRSKSEEVSSNQKIRAGISNVFRSISTLDKSTRTKIMDILYEQIRNPIAHTGFTSKQVILSGDIPCPLAYGQYRGELSVVINPHNWYECLRHHFDGYIQKLSIQDPLDPEIRGLQQLFEERVYVR